VTITLEQPAPVDLGQAPQAFRLEQLHRPMQLCEVLLHHGIGQLGEDLRPELLDDGPELAHVSLHSNIRSKVTPALRAVQ
jgi:hypothetical protein